MKLSSSVCVIGGGIVGLATAWKISLARPEIHICVLDKEKRVGSHQSSHNSGVLHCGLYYKPGSMKAQLAVSGIREMTAFCHDHNIPHEICGKLVVATNDEEQARLKTLQQRGSANGLKGIQWLGRDEMRDREPHVGGSAALKVPEEGIVDYQAVCDTLKNKLLASGHEVRTQCKVTSLRREKDQWIISTTQNEFRADLVVNSAGLHSDRVCALAGSKPDACIIPFRGEYFKLKKDRQPLVNHLIYPVPDPAFPFLGVHFTRLIHGGVEAGPNAVLALSREGYRKRDVNLRDMKDAATFQGLWRFVAKYPSMCLQELYQSFSRNAFARALQKLVPEIQPDDLEAGGAGVRAQAMTSNGSLVEDFRIVEAPGILHILNAPSPAATASLAIGSEITSRLFQTSKA